jgi:hypothetical protein
LEQEAGSGSFGLDRNTVKFNSLVDEALLETKEEDWRKYYNTVKVTAQGSYFKVIAVTRKSDNMPFACKWFTDKNE